MSRRCSSGKRVALLALGLAVGLPGPTAAPARAQEPVARPANEVPAPSTVLGFVPGEDRRLAGWDQILAWFGAASVASDRMRLDTIGRTTLDRPLVMAVLSDPANLSRLDEIRATQERLADPRAIAGAAERAALLDSARLVVLVTAGVHAAEVGTPLAAIRLAHRLATAEDPATRRILSECVVLLVPALDPDGLDAVVEWYRSTLDMPWEGAPPPFLPHHYAGHDLNRDAYAFTQVETRALVEGAYAPWRPQIVLDVHQQGPLGSRSFVPPWIDPIEPNVDPLLVAGSTALGGSVAASLLRGGRKGVLVAGEYDAWSPARALAHYRGAVRILSETASSRLATPIEVPFEELRAGRGYDARKASWNFPVPWPGGRWTLGDAVGAMESASVALLRQVSLDRRVWAETSLRVLERASAGWEEWPAAWAIPADGPDPGATARLLWILREAGVEIRRAESPFSAAGRRYDAGTWLVPMRQPYAAFAQAVLAPRPYPGRVDAETGDAERPYDVTAHCLPLLLGAAAVPLARTPDVETSPATEMPSAEPRPVRGLTSASGVLVGLYRSYVPAPDEGWTRWLFDRHSVPYAPLDNPDVARGDLARRFTAIVLPSMPEDVLLHGFPKGSEPPDLTGGLEGPGVEALRTFVEDGGTLVALNEAARFAIHALDLPVRDALAEVGPDSFLAPGAQLSLRVDSAAAASAGLPARTAAWFENGPLLRPRPGSGARVLARYGTAPVVLSGWVHGAELLAGGAALVEVPMGRGRVLLFGFQPQYRGQSRATFPLLFDALRRRPGQEAR